MFELVERNVRDSGRRTATVMLNGQATPLILTVTVTFQLQ